MENGVWVLAANKHGVEAQSIVYCGRSCIIDPSGNKVAVAGPDQTEIICAEVDLDHASICVLDERRPDAYRSLSEPTQCLPVFQKASLPFHSDDVLSVSVLQITASTLEQYLQKIEALGHTLAPQDTDLAACPVLASQPFIEGYEDDPYEEAYEGAVERISDLAAHTGIAFAVSLFEREEDRLYKSAALISCDGLVGTYRQVHLEPDEQTVFTPGSSLMSVYNISGADVGILMGRDMYFPEAARCLMLLGADLIIWMNHSVAPYDMTFLRGRALENRVYMVHADSVSTQKPGTSAIVSPDGQPIARALQDQELAISAQIFHPWARNKNMAPNTDAVQGRRPEAYSALTERVPYA